jgi:hypothetical protein
MKLIWSIVFFMIVVQLGFSQFVNNGATVTIQPGATLKVESNVINQGAGTFTNNGTLEVTGNFTNSATFTSGANSEIIFSGTAASTVTPGGAAFRDVTLNKTNNNVVLAGNMIVNGVLDFSQNNNKVILGSHNLTMGSTASVTGAGSNKYVVATGSGRMIKPITANGVLTFEVGDNDAATNYSPVTANISGSAYSGASVGVNLVNAVHPNKPVTSNDFITRYWDVLASGITGYSNTLTGTFVPANDVTGNQANIDGAAWNGSVWSYTNASHSGNTITVTTTSFDTELSGFGRGVALNAKVFLNNVSGGLMDDYLRTLAGQFPLTDPYTTAPFSTSGLFTYVPAQSAATTTQTVLDNNNVVDWVFVELRTGPSGNTSVVASKSGLLKNDGTIINPDGSPFSYTGISAGNYKVAVKHRNHCGFMTDGTYVIPNPSLLNFTNNSVTFYEPNHAALKLQGGVYAMWTGDASVDASVDGGDVNFIRPLSGSIIDEYNRADVNLDGSVDGGDVNLTRANSGNVGYQID